MSEEETRTQSKPWQWPGEWMRDEKFWRDVGTRFLAGLLVVGTTYVAAVLLGYLQQPEIFRMSAFAAVGISFIGIGVCCRNLFWAIHASLLVWLDPDVPKRQWPSTKNSIYSTILLIFFLSIVIGVYLLRPEGSPMWPMEQ